MEQLIQAAPLHAKADRPLRRVCHRKGGMLGGGLQSWHKGKPRASSQSRSRICDNFESFSCIAEG
jgi:hypothetical protein